MAVPARRTEPARDERVAPKRVTQLVPCDGHAFDPDLVCPCGITWSEHQATPRACTRSAQRNRAGDGAGEDR